jgi:hypothetical protein
LIQEKNGKGKLLIKFKRIWRWYLEDVIKCLNLGKIKDYGMTLEEYCIISKCNGVFTEAYRPDIDEERTEKEIIIKIKERKIDSLGEHLNREKYQQKIYSYNRHENKNGIVEHDANNSECKHDTEIIIKNANLDFFRTVIYASTRRENFFVVANTSRKALKQTGDGHFSPVAAYHFQSDNVLLLDAARFKYNSVWLTIPMIFNSFKSLDKETNLFRGFILSSRYY